MLMVVFFICACGRFGYPDGSVTDTADARVTDTADIDTFTATTDTSADTAADTDVDDNADTESDSGADIDADVDVETGVDAEIGTDTGVDADGDRETDTLVSWITIDGSDFMMGCPDNAGGLEGLPEHLVSVPTFEMLKTEVTVAQYRECVNRGACSEPSITAEDCTGIYSEANNWLQPGRDNHPINCVTWQQAVDFCAWFGGRLPSESEWEFAAGNGQLETLYPWGETEPTCELAQVNIGGPGCSTGLTSAVCSKPAGNTTHSLCDMAGNVWEWTADYMHQDYIGAPTDGSAWLGSSTGYRITRGAGYLHDFEPPDHLRTTQRWSSHRNIPWTDLGFRCARNLDD